MSSRPGAAQGPKEPPGGLQHVASPVFANYIDVYAVDDHEELNAALLAVIADWRSADKGVSSSNQLGWHSSRDLFSREEPPFLKLFGHLDHAVTASTRRHWKEFHPERNVATREGWANVSGKGAFNTIHEHDTFHYSGAYYVAVGKVEEGRSGAIEFLNPMGISALPLPNRSYISPPKITLVPKAGSIMVFPSYLRHWVYPNQNDEDRVSIAFNYRFSLER